MSVFNSCLLYISSGDSPLWHHPAELPEGRGAVQSQEIWRGKMVSNTATPVVSFSAGGQDNSSTRVSFPVFFLVVPGVWSSDRSLPRSEPSQSAVTQTRHQKSIWFWGHFSLHLRPTSVTQNYNIGIKKKKRKTRGHWWRDTFWQNAVTLQLMLQSMDLKKNLTNQFGLALRWGT